MLEPRSATGRPAGGARPRRRRRRARGRRAARRSRRARACRSGRSTSPAAAAARAMSAWFSLRDPAPCRITSPPHGSPSGRSSTWARAKAGMRHASAPIMAAATRAVYPEASVRAGRPPADRRLRRGRAGARVRHARVRDGRGRPARPRARVPRRRSRRTTTGPGEVIFASKACPVTAVLRVFAEEGLGVRRRVGRRAAPGAEGRVRARADLPARQREVRGGAARWRSQAGVGWVVVDNLEDVAKLARVLPAGAPPARAAADPPGRRRRHARGDPHRPRRVEVRPRPARGARARAATRRRTSTCRASTSTSARSSTTRRRTAPRSACSPGWATSRSTASAAATRSPTPPTTGRRRSTTSVAAVVEAAHDLLGPGKRLVIEPGRALVANAGVTLYTVESVKRLPGGARIVAVDGGMSDNPRPMLYDAAYDAGVADRFGEDGRAGDGRRQALRVRRRADPPHAAARRRSPATCSSRR